MRIKLKSKEHSEQEIFADVLERLYNSDEVFEGSSREYIKEMTKILMTDLALAFKKMKNRRCPNEFVIPLEMIEYASEELHEKVFELLNQMILDDETSKSSDL